MKICTVEGCERKQKARTWCTVHWGRWRRHGDPTADGWELRRAAMQPPTQKDRLAASERLFGKNTTPGANGCLMWEGSIDRGGYGIFTALDSDKRAHRYAWERANGPIPEGMVIDHMCHNRACVNIEHLRLATTKQNAENLGPVRSNNTSGYRGVSLHRPSGKWFAYIRHNSKRIHLGSFDSADEAGEVARLARLNLFTYNDLDRSA